jgi:hypothetical protein
MEVLEDPEVPELEAFDCTHCLVLVLGVLEAHLNWGVRVNLGARVGGRVAAAGVDQVDQVVEPVAGSAPVVRLAEAHGLAALNKKNSQ